MTNPSDTNSADRDLPKRSIESNPIISDRQVDRQGLIDRSLAQVFTPVGVKFKSSIKRYPQTRHPDTESTVIQTPVYRLWVVCSSQKSLDYQLLAEPLAKALRSLDLQEFQAAVIQFSKSAAQVADWRLKIDLVPPTVMLYDWAKWGDAQAITKLLNLALEPIEMQVSSVFKNLTLHIFCTFKHSESGKFPTKKIALKLIAPLLAKLSPQGIQAATIYGLKSSPGVESQLDESPVWTHWLDLPALKDPKLSPTPLILAEQGDFDALDFLLHRFLNPDLEQCFAVGGIKLHLLRRGRILHVMSEAPTCPLQSQVALPVVKILSKLALPGIRGVRVYGRISGQITPLWTHGVDFDLRPLELSPSAPVVEELSHPPVVEKIELSKYISEYLVATGIWQPQLRIVTTNELVFQPRFKWEPSLLLLFLGFGLTIGGDLGLSSLMADTERNSTSIDSPSQLSLNNPLLEQKLAQYQVICKSSGAPDVLVIGSSRALRGLDPAVLRQSLKERGYGEIKVYNFGINGATAQVEDLLLRQLLNPQQLPKLVIWLDGARAFNSGRIDRTYETIALSDRYRQLSLASSNVNNSSPIFQAQSSFKNTYQAIDTRVDSQLSNISPVYHHRNRLKTWLQSTVPSMNELVDSSGIVDGSGNQQEPQIDLDGFLPLNVKFEPTTYYQAHPKVTGDSDGDYTNFELLGSQHQALIRVMKLLSNRRIPLVFVNSPVSDLYLDKFRQEHEMNFKYYMQQLMQLDQLTFVDMDGIINTKYDRFSDPSHLNRFGASEASLYLTQKTEIPWERLLVNSIIK